MGVNYYQPTARKITVTVGGVPQELALLGARLGRGGGRPSRCRAALVPHGDPDPRIGQVIAWEPGMGSVSDYKWDDMPQLGQTIAAPDGTVVLARDGVPLSFDAAVADGILLDDGRLAEYRRPRVSSASLEIGYIEGRSFPTSLGESHVRNDRLLIELEDGTKDSQQLYVETRLGDIGRDVIGMTKFDAFDSVRCHAKGRLRVQSERCRPCLFGGMKIASRESSALLAPDVDGSMQFSHFKNDRLEGSHGSTIADGVAELARQAGSGGDWVVDGQAMIAWDVTGPIARGFILMADKDGGLLILDGPPLPQKIASVKHGAGAVAQIVAGASLAPWGPDTVSVAPDRMAAALGDLSLYVSDLTSGDSSDASFEDWRRRVGIDYGRPEYSLRILGPG